MNRIIIVGNGFDLAHDLKTKYEDFINWYWGRWLKLLYSSTNQIEKDELFEIRAKYSSDCLCNYFYTALSEQNVYSHIEKTRKENGLYSILSPFLYRVSMSIETKGWVDIEADYYAMLVGCKGKKDELEKLNKDFAVIQSLLVEYLNEIQKERVNTNILCDDIKEAMLSPFSKNEIAVSSEKEWWEFVEKRSRESITFWKPFLLGYSRPDLLRQIGRVRYVYGQIDEVKFDSSLCLSKEDFPEEYLLPEKIMLLNFNYTKTADLYMPDKSNSIVNHIHGELSNRESVIFGYGDESDDEYKAIVKQNDNEYLKHIKTNRYLEDDKYRQLLSFINSAPYQVCIMGHSCGLSDKTMLNTLFEHKNCVSIKPYYYVNEQGKDNYLDMVQNISRNFTNPQLMRDRVVNKTFCEPLPQFNKE